MYKEQNKKDRQLFNKELSEKIDSLLNNDQKLQNKLLAEVGKGEKKSKSKITAIENEIDEVYLKNCKKCLEIFNEFGFPNFDLVGKQSSYNFWIITQHCDVDVEFQKGVLKELKKAVKQGKAYPNNYAYLTDRVRINQSLKQKYGTQVYRNKSGLYVSYPIENKKKVNKLRDSLGLETIEEYLNFMNSLY